MGYNTSFTTRQRIFKRRHSEVSIGGDPRSWTFAYLGPTLSRFSVLMDINDDLKGEMLLLTRYLLDYFRRLGFIRAAHNFAKEANIDLEQPLEGSYMEYSELWLEERNNLDYWTFFWYKKLKALKENPFEGKGLKNRQPLSVDQSSLGQSFASRVGIRILPQHGGQDNVHAMHSKVGRFLDRGMIHGPKRVLYQILRRFFYAYFARCPAKIIGGILVEDSEIDEEQPYDGPSGSKSSNSDSNVSRVRKRRRYIVKDASRVRKRRRCIVKDASRVRKRRRCIVKDASRVRKRHRCIVKDASRVRKRR